MKYLTICRHAKSSWDNPDWEDIQRPLNERGKQAIIIIGKFLKKKEIHPDLMISSPAARALETAKGLSKMLKYPTQNIIINKSIYFGDVKEIMRLISGINNDFNDVFLFGHEPILSGLIYQLTGEAVGKFPTCSVYRMAFDINNWTGLSAQKGKCEFYVYPKLLQNE